MRRRLATILTAALLGSALLLPLTAAPAVGADTADGVGADTAVAAGADNAVVLASEGFQTDEGPEPMDPDAEENEFAPPQYEPNWTWRLGGKGLLAAFLIVAAYVGLMYYLRVARPRSKSEQS